MTSPSTPVQAPTATNTPPLPTKEVKEPLSSATTATDEKTMPEPVMRNDDSNPQGGTSNPPGRSASRTQSKSDVAPQPRQQRPSLKIPPTAKDERKLFCGGLPADVTDEEFSTFFSQFGSIIDSIVMFDYETGRSRGFGFVTYQDPSVAHHLLSLGRIPMRDKLVEIKAAEPKEGRGRPHNRGGRRKAMDEATPTASAVPEAFPIGEDAMYPYGQAAYHAMPFYGYPPAPYGAPVYAPTPAPYPAAFVQGYVAPVFYPPDAAAVPPVMPPEQPPAAFAGYAYIPFVPPPAGAPEQK